MFKSGDPSSISFTAMYTGYVWYANNMSPVFLTTPAGRFFYASLLAPEWLGKIVVGGNIKTYLLQRHIIIDHLVKTAIEEEGFSQVIEIACGLSPRGYRFRQRHHNDELVYIEADLPAMAARKKKLLQEHGALTSDGHRVVECNILEQGTDTSLESVLRNELDRSRKTLVITEGLVNYFSLPVITDVWKRINQALSSFPEGRYITDVYPAIQSDPMFIVRKWMQDALALVTRSDFSLHFNTDEEARDCFLDCGFSSCQVIDPQTQYDALPIPRARKSLVRVIENRH